MHIYTVTSVLHQILFAPFGCLLTRLLIFFFSTERFQIGFQLNTSPLLVAPIHIMQLFQRLGASPSEVYNSVCKRRFCVAL